MKTNSPSNGFTLLEVILALGVLVIGLLGVISMIGNGLRSGRNAIDNCVPAMIAEDIFSQIRGSYCSYNSPATSLVGYRSTETVSTSTLTNLANTSTNYTVKIFYNDPIPNFPLNTPNLVGVHVEIYWPSPYNLYTNVFATQIAKLW